MSFFRDLTADLRTAAEDLRANGLNLDSLREEIGNEKREPLPAAPPLRKKQPTAKLLEAPPVEEDDGLLRKGHEWMASTFQLPAADVPENAEPPIELPGSEPFKPAPPPKPAPPSNGGLVAAGSTAGTLVAAVKNTVKQGVMGEQDGDARKLQMQLEQTQRRYERCKAGLYRFEASAAHHAAECARLAVQLTATAKRNGHERAELERLRSAARRDAELAERAQFERDASAAELEAVALRQVDALQAEVAALKREKRRAETLERDLQRLLAEKKVEQRAESTDKKLAAELRAAKVQLAAARSAASASARAARAAVDVAEDKARAAEGALGKARLEVAELKASLAKAVGDRDAFRKKHSELAAASTTARVRNEDAAALRELLREALTAKSALETQLSVTTRDLERSDELRATEQRKAFTETEGLRAELAAGRRALREARAAIVDRGVVSAYEDERPSDFDDDNRSVSSLSLAGPGTTGAAEYLRTVVRTALPSPPRHDNKRTRLVPVLRSLLGLPHDSVVQSLDALARVHGGGDFALALLNAASSAEQLPDKARNIASTATVQREHDAVSRNVELTHEVDDVKRDNADLRAALDAKSSELIDCQHSYDDRLRAALEAKAELVTRLDATTREASDLTESMATRCHELEAAVASARDKAEQAYARQRTFEDQVADLLDKRKLGLDAEQLEYLRGTLLCYLKGLNQPNLRKQLAPVLVQVLKYPPDDPRALALVAIGD